MERPQPARAVVMRRPFVPRSVFRLSEVTTMITIADIDARLAREAEGLRSPYATVRTIAWWRIDWLLDLRLRTRDREPAA